jgi:hypothetical protein
VDVPADVVVGENEEAAAPLPRRSGSSIHDLGDLVPQARPDGAEAILAAIRDAFVDDDEQGTFVDVLESASRRLAR